MAPRPLTPKARKELLKTAQFYSQPQHQWRMDASLQLDLRRNLTLLRELYRIAGNNPYHVRVLLNYCKTYVLVNAPRFQRPEFQNLDPSHPSVINNIMHPLNPSNPLNLLLNPSMNLLLQQAVNETAAIEESESEETAENEQQTDQLIASIVAEESIQQAAQQHIIDPEFKPYKVLGLPLDPSQKEIQAACLSQLAEQAPAPDKPPSHDFIKVAAAATLIGTTEHHNVFRKTIEHVLKKDLHHVLSPTPVK